MDDLFSFFFVRGRDVLLLQLPFAEMLSIFQIGIVIGGGHSAGRPTMGGWKLGGSTAEGDDGDIEAEIEIAMANHTLNE